MMKIAYRMAPVGIRLQLTLWYSAVFALLMLLSAVLFYSRVQTTLAQSLDTALQLQAQQIAGDITEGQGGLAIHDATADLPGFNPNDHTNHVAPADVNLGVVVRVLTVSGTPFR